MSIVVVGRADAHWLYALGSAVMHSRVITVEAIEGYELGECVRSTRSYAEYRATRTADKAAVFIEFCAPVVGMDAAAHAHEFARLRALDRVGGVAPVIELRELGARGWALISAAGKGLSLDVRVGGRVLGLEEFYDLAEQIAGILASVHAQGVVHGALEPTRVCIEREPGRISLTGFGIAVVRERGNREIHCAQIHTVSLPYLAPEQVGRGLRRADARSDLYALGVIFYELLCGRPPFVSSDPVALSYAHLARIPHSLNDLRPGLPEQLVRLVGRLLAKDPRDRYQSARGLLVDLELCAAAARAKKVPRFAWGAADLPVPLEPSGRLFGREAQLAALSRAFERTRGGGTELMLVHGPGGVGKTALLHSLQLRSIGCGGILVAGKYERARRGVPLLGFAQALSSLIDHLWFDDEARLARLRSRLIDNLGSLAHELLAFIPKLGLVLGELGEPPAGDMLESSNRLMIAIGRLLEQVASRARPLVLVLDDLQWADPVSSKVLVYLRDHCQAKGLLLLGAYRNAEIEGAHPLKPLLEQLAEEPEECRDLTLGPLSHEGARGLVADMLRTSPERVAPLVEMLCRHTRNSPLSILHALGVLEHDGWLNFAEGQWRWSGELPALWADAAGGAHKAGSDGSDGADGVESFEDEGLGLAVRVLASRAKGEREVLMAATCLGHRFEASSLAVALGHGGAELRESLNSLVAGGLLHVDGAQYRFAHDSVEEAAGLGLTQAQVRTLHRRVVPHLRRELEDDTLGARIYELAWHLDWLIDASTPPRELVEVAQLERLAATAAGRVAAYAQAERDAHNGLRALALLDSSTRAEERELEVALRLELARSVSLQGQRERGAVLFEALVAECEGPLQRARLSSIHVAVLTMTGQFEAAVSRGLEGLSELGIEVSRHPSKTALTACFAKLDAMYSSPLRAKVLALSPSEDPLVMMRAELTTQVMLVARALGGSLGSMLMLNHGLSLFASGWTPHTAQVLTQVAISIGTLGGDYERATELVELALELCDDPGTAMREVVINGATAGVLHWARSYRVCASHMDLAYELSLQRGNFELGAHSLLQRTSFELSAGLPLDLLAPHCTQTRVAAEQVGLREFGVALRSGERSIAALMGRSDEVRALDPLAELLVAVVSEAASLQQLSSQALALTHAMLGLVFWGQGARAVVLARPLAAGVGEALRSTVLLSQFRFYYAMAVAQGFARGDARSSEAWSELVEARDVFRTWAAIHAGNMGCRLALIEAELARIEARDLDAEAAYEQAAQLAATHRFVHIEALAWERMARARLHRGGATLLAEVALGRARALYVEWGAGAKATALEQEFPVLMGPAVGRTTISKLAPMLVRAEQGLELSSVLESSRAISEGRGPVEIAKRLIRAAFEIAGASRGVLLSHREGGELRIEFDLDSEGLTERLPGPLRDTERSLPAAFLRAVARDPGVRSFVDASANVELARDPYVRARGVLSMCCLPILRHGDLIGLFYLDHNHLAGVFTQEVLGLLEHLGAQAAASLESTLLTETLRDREARWRALVTHAPVDIAIIDRRGNIEFLNHGCTGAAGPLSVDEMLGRPVAELFMPESAEQVSEAMAEVFARGTELSSEVQRYGSDRNACSWTLRLGPILREGEVDRVTLICADITAQRQLAQQLRQSQKMQAVGTLAGGVAHDFNNLLSMILGSAELALEGLLDPREALEEVLQAGERAAALTRQLLAFSRKQVLNPSVLGFDAHVAEFSSMLRRLLSERIELRLELDAKDGCVRFDPSQLEQIVLNLAVNARDAMPRGGTLHISSAQVERGGAAWIRLSVRDTGEGMDAKTRERIFEPFFTTKPKGKGTGLGLSTVHGIVNQSGGEIEVESTVGVGTCFHVYLEVSEIPEFSGADAGASVPRGDETILLVEDEPTVRRLAAAMLGLQGYAVLEAEDVAGALLVAEDRSFDLLLTDVVLPGQATGGELAEQLRAQRPSLPVLFTSGYTDDALVHHGVYDGSAGFLSKPYSREHLCRLVRELLDRPPTHVSR